MKNVTVDLVPPRISWLNQTPLKLLKQGISKIMTSTSFIAEFRDMHVSVDSSGKKMAEWPSGLRRQIKALVFRGVGSNPTSVKRAKAQFFFGEM